MISARILEPQPHHADGLVALSTAFACEHEWSQNMPIGRIHTFEAAQAKLFGDNVQVTLVAEAPDGKVMGYVGVYQHPDAVSASLLIGAAHRRQGLGKQLIDAAFERLPPGMTVQAWVSAVNRASLAAMGSHGFSFDRAIVHEDQEVHVFIRKQKQNHAFG